MPYLARAVARANEQLSPSGDLDQGLVADLRNVSSVAEAAVVLGLAEVIAPQHQEELGEFLANLPPAIDAAIVAAIKNSLDRGVRTTVTWQPGYEHEVRVWDVADGQDGMVNVHLISPNPFEGYEG
jgi:hypothetical protein